MHLATSWSPPSILNAGHNSDPKGYSADGAPIVPCGLVAWSLFNDTYTISVNKKAIEVNKKDIAWQSDKNKKFGNDVYPRNFQNGNLIGGAKLNASIPVHFSLSSTSNIFHHFYVYFLLDIDLT